MMKQIIKKLLLATLMFTLLVGHLGVAHAADDSIDEMLGEPSVVYGDALTDAQVEEVKRLLEVDADAVNEFTVNGQDLNNYIGGNPNANMYSSVKITHKDNGHGIVVNIVTADNITEVTSEMYGNALLTAGVENAEIEVASPVKVTGESALTGIYKAYDANGAELDQDRMEVANEELSLTTDLSEKEGMSDEKVTELMTEIKKKIAEQDPATREDVEEIVEEQLSKLEIELSEEDRQLLIDLFEKMREIDIDFDKVRDQLEDLTSAIKNRLDDLEIDEGFWDKVVNWFKNLFNSIFG